MGISRALCAQVPKSESIKWKYLIYLVIVDQFVSDQFPINLPLLVWLARLAKYKSEVGLFVWWL